MTDLPKHHPDQHDCEVSSVGMLNVPTEQDRQLLIELFEERCERMESDPRFTTDDEAFWAEFTLYQELLGQLKLLE